MTDKILGWPEPSEVGGHRVKRQSTHLNRSKDTFKCVDCGLQELGGVTIFSVGVDGCAGRPESLNHLSLEGWYRNEGEWPADPATVSRATWLDFAEGVGLKVENVEEIDDGDACARFSFKGALYELHYNQPGPHGMHHIHAVKIEEAA